VGFIGEQGGLEAVLSAELVLRCDRIGGYPHNIRARSPEISAKPLKINGFAGAGGGMRLGVEVDDQFAALEIGERNLFRRRRRAARMQKPSIPRPVPSS
jgi:hypothetical protein